MRIRWGDQRFKIPRWNDRVWPWGAVTNPKNMKAADFPGNGGTSEFLKSVVRGYFRSKNLDPSDHVNPNLNREKLRKKNPDLSKKLYSG